MTTVCTFSEADHPRHPRGQFASKVNDAPTAELIAGIPDDGGTSEEGEAATDERGARNRESTRTAMPARRHHLSREAASILRDAKATAAGAVTDLNDSFQSVFD